ncbi:MAG: hypothetical protein L0I24_06120 [Pseudonocardia sp.]|nr:hypothetical protein [Pseudonocardia sp.]
MNEPVETALGTAAGMLAVAVDRIEEALPALGRVIADVEQDWLDAAGRAWVDRAVQLHRTLDRELDGALAAGRLVAALGERVAEEAAGRRYASPEDGRAVGAEDGAAGPGGPPGAGVPRPRAAGPRLGGTDAQRVDEERGMRIAQLDGD